MKQSIISTTQLAKICGVSQGTVDRALNNRKGISPKTKEKILTIAKEYGYRPNIHARSMAGRDSMLIGVVVFDLDNQYFSNILTSIEKYCTPKGYSTIVMFTNKDVTKELECLQHLYRISVDGIILCPINSGTEFENYLLSLDTPIITIGNRLKQFPHVGINDAHAMQYAAEFVLSNGYNRLIYVKPTLADKNTFAQTERLNAFIQVMEQTHTEYVITDLTNAANQIALHRKNAFICPTDIYALKLLPIVENCSAGIIGFDNICLIDMLKLKLDSISYDIEKTAKLAADYIIDDIVPDTEIEYKLVKRGSIQP